MLDYTATLYTLGTIYFAVCTLLYFLRVFHRRNKGFRLVGDDILITIAYILLIGAYISILLLTNYNLGRPLDLERPTTLATRRMQLIMATAAFAMGNAQLVVTKLAIALTCYNFSRVTNVKLYRQISKGVLILQSISLILIIPPMIPCVPLSSLWHGHLNHCQNFTGLVLGLSGLSLVNDLILLLAPLPILIEVTRTHFHKNRMALWFLAFLGMLVVLGDCVQITYSKGYMLTQLTDPIGSHAKQIQATLWFVFRNNVIFVVACLPQARATVSHLLSLLRARSHTPDLEVPQETTEKQPAKEHTKELDKVFEMFKHNYNSNNLALVPTRNSSSTKDPNSPHVTSLEFISTVAKQEALSNFDDQNQWLRPSSMPVAVTPTGILPANNPFTNTSPFDNQRKDWEEIYPAEAVRILDFDEQFKASQQDLTGSDPSAYGRSTLQKQYYDKVAQIRDHMRQQAEESKHQRKNSDTLGNTAERFRHQSDTLPRDDAPAIQSHSKLEETAEENHVYLY